MNSRQESLFKEDRKRTRNVESYVRTASKDGSLSVRIEPEVARRVRNYCKLKRLNCKKFVEKIIRERIDDLEASRFDDMSKEELVELIQRMEAEKEGEA